jgi:hypothetical protein
MHEEITREYRPALLIMLGAVDPIVALRTE